MEKVIFLDRDGTLNEEVNYLHRKEDLRILPGVPEALRAFRDHGYKLVVVTNQAGVARGYYPEAAVDALHGYLNQILEPAGAKIDAFFFCPHHPEHGVGAYKRKCHCRKPETGMFQQAEALFPIDKAASWMIGDKLIDVEAGRNYGVRTVLVGTGYGKGEREKAVGRGDFPAEKTVGTGDGPAEKIIGMGDFPADGAGEADRPRPFDYYAEDLMEAARFILEQETVG